MPAALGARPYIMTNNVKHLKTPSGSNTLSGAGAYETLKDSLGRFRTKSLFIEHKHPEYPAPYTLKEYDKDGAMSFYLKYMEYSDPTEYKVAMGLLGSWRHWTILRELSWFKPLLEQWRAELKVKMESERLQEMEAHVKRDPGSPQSIQATKWMAERYGERSASKRGRPSKAEKEAALKHLTEEEQLAQEDAERLGL